jgi:hypothetical protein
MKRLLSVVVFIVFLPLLGMAQSDFDGTWKVDLTKSTMPVRMGNSEPSKSSHTNGRAPSTVGWRGTSPPL